MFLPWYEILFRLGLAVLCGMLVGMEREHRHRPAGVKTHILVCIGAALVSLIQIKMVEQVIASIQADPSLAEVLKVDYARLGAQVISGVGFLGAGTILRNKGSIKGLTTAATLWLIACVGLAIGMGYYLIGIMTISLTMIVLVFLHLLQNKRVKGRGVKQVEVTMSDKRAAMNFLNNYCAARSIFIRDIQLCDTPPHEDLPSTPTYRYTLLLPRAVTLEGVLMDWHIEDSIVSAVLEEDALTE